MKGSVACFLAAVSSIPRDRLQAPVYVGCTADEEVGMLGATRVAERSQLYREMVEAHTRTIIGEPTELEVVHAHKGGVAFLATAEGKAAHSSTAQGINANWRMIPFLTEMKNLYEELESDPQWRNQDFDPPTMTLNLGVNDHTPAINITPPQSVCSVYFRPMPEMDVAPLIERCREAAARHGLEFEITMQADPMWIAADSPFVQECLEFASSARSKTVAYGTDGARFGELKRMVVMGPGSIAQAHTHDEWISLDQLNQGTETYARMIRHWCCQPPP